MGLILFVILIILLLGALPVWPYSRSWGPGPGGLLGLVLVVILILMLLGHVPTAWGQEAADVIVEGEQATVVDEIVQAIVGLVTLVVGGLGAWLVNEARLWLRSKLGEMAAERIGDALERAVAVGQASAGDTVRQGAEYLKEQLPDSIRQLKMSDAQVQGLVRAEATKRGTLV